MGMDEHAQDDVVVAHELLSVEEVSRALAISPQTVRRHVRSGRLPAVTVGSSIRVSRSAVAEFTVPYEVRSRP